MQILYRFYFFKIEDYSMPKTESDLVKTTHVFLLVLSGSSNLKNTEQNHLFLLDALWCNNCKMSITNHWQTEYCTAQLWPSILLFNPVVLGYDNTLPFWHMKYLLCFQIDWIFGLPWDLLCYWVVLIYFVSKSIMGLDYIINLSLF